MRCARGQGTIEYLAVVLLVAVVAGAGTAVAAGASGGDIAPAVTRQFIRALCKVTGGDCDRDRAPCPTHSKSERRGATVTIAIVKLGRHHMLLREERSDGTVALTLVEEDQGGVEAGTGVKAALSLGRSKIAVGGEARAAALVKAGSGSTWITKGEETAMLEARLRAHFDAAPAKPLLPGFAAERVLPTLRAPDETFGDRGLDVSGHAGASRGARAADVGISAADTAGSRVDTATGRRMFYLRRRNSASASVAAKGATGEGAGASATEYAVTVDRDGRPVTLTVIDTGTLSGSMDLPPRLQPLAGALAVPTRGNRAWVTESHLDLSEPDNLAAAQQLVAQLRAPRPRLGGLVDVPEALERALEERAVINARTYSMSGSSYGGQLAGRVGGVGAAVDITANETESAHLVAAMTRGGDGRWRRRDDCLKEART
ncbi:MAG: hypothetical protein QOJ21_3117 [Solirubrobacteraceae bacterium]|jgi:hypothetical protein|nr:hypothetical protein [Solirubrobacteraceae bacterium]